MSTEQEQQAGGKAGSLEEWGGDPAYAERLAPGPPGVTAEAPGVTAAVSTSDGAADAAEGEDEPAPEPVFKNVEEFVRLRFLPVYIRPEGGQFRWCKEWWRHAEAVSRFQALWHAWEVLRWEAGTGMAVWYRDHLDFQMGILLGDNGPFRECTSRRHQDPRPLPADPAPEGWFEDEW